MGSCISKCIPRNHSELEEFDHHHHVEDKLVISQAPTSTTPNIIPVVSNKISPSPPSPSNSSTCSVSSFTGTTTTNSKYTSSSSSTSSSASSVICSKDRSFSNEYLWSCYKENPHIIRINSLKESSTLSSLPAKPRKLEAATQQPNIQQKVSNCSTTCTTPQKRVRSRSPTVTRKKSFRRDQPEKPTSTYSLQQSRALRSPSPSRRFSNVNNGDKYWGVHVTNTLKESHSKRMSGTTKVNTAGNYASGLAYSRMENLRPPTPNSSCSTSRLIGPPCLTSTRETFIHRIGSKIDEFAVAEALAHPDNVDAFPMEDIDNPLIALDCFIFL